MKYFHFQRALSTGLLLFYFLFFAAVAIPQFVHASASRVTISPMSAKLPENGGSQIFTITLPEPLIAPGPDSATATITLTPSDSRIQLDTTTINYLADNWEVPQQFHVTMQDDAIVNPGNAATINVSVSSNSEYYNGYTTSIPITIADDEATYSLIYSSDPNGHMNGTTVQNVQGGHDGTAVTAVPSVAYKFVNWSDGSTANPRTDTVVAGDISVTANFALANAPTVVNIPVTDITRTSATFGGTVTSAGDGTISTEEIGYGVRYLLPGEQPQELQIVGQHTGTLGTGDFGGTATNLLCGREYLYRAFAINSYGREANAENAYFTTLPCAPQGGVVAIFGCTDRSATNYNPGATLSDSSKCVYKPVQQTQQQAPVLESTLESASTTHAFVFNKNLKFGMDDPDVAELQKFLDTHGFPIATTGPGSLDQLSTIFGKKTKNSLILFQKSVHLLASGYFGPKTRAYVNKLLAGKGD